MRSAAGDFSLVGSILALNYSMMHILTLWFRLPIVVSKLVTGSLLFIVSCLIQRKVVFVKRSPGLVAESVPVDIGLMNELPSPEESFTPEITPSRPLESEQPSPDLAVLETGR